MRHRAKRGRRFGLLITVLTVILLFGMISYNKTSLEAKEELLVRQQEELKTKMNELKEEKAEIEDYATYVQTPKFIEDTAREKLGLVYPNEIIFEPQK